MTVPCPSPTGHKRTGCSSRLRDTQVWEAKWLCLALCSLAGHWRERGSHVTITLVTSSTKHCCHLEAQLYLVFSFLYISDTKVSRSMDFFVTVMCTQASGLHKLLFCTANNCAARIIHFPRNASAVKAVFQQLGRRKGPAEGWDRTIFFIWLENYSEYLHFLTGNTWEAAGLTCPPYSTHTWWDASMGCDVCMAPLLQIFWF